MDSSLKGILLHYTNGHPRSCGKFGGTYSPQIMLENVLSYPEIRSPIPILSLVTSIIYGSPKAGKPMTDINKSAVCNDETGRIGGIEKLLI